jgi:hypothetical protein
MSIIPGRYGGYGVRPPRPGSASRMVEPIPEGWKNACARAERPWRSLSVVSPLTEGLSIASSACYPWTSRGGGRSTATTST